MVDVHVKEAFGNVSNSGFTVEGWWNPNGHERQAVPPSAVVYMPVEHDWHTSSDFSTAVENVPA